MSIRRLVTAVIIAGTFLLFTEIPYLHASEAGEIWHTPPDKWSEPRIFHSEFNEEYEKRIIISRDASSVDVSDKNLSPNKAYWFVIDKPDFLKPSPWNTTITIYNERDYLITIRLEDHNHYGVTAQWINEKLLYVQVWWGRVLGSYLIYDVEKERILIKEMVHDGVIPYQQFKGL